MRRRFALPALGAAFFLLTGFSATDVTTEEKFLLRHFAMIHATDVYDVICSKADPASLNDLSKPENQMRNENQQMVSVRIGELMKVHTPNLGPDEAAKRLITVSNTFEDNTRKLLTEKGCKSSEAASVLAARKVYTTTDSAELSKLIDGQIVKAGGKVTPPEKFKELEAPVPDKK